MLRITFPLQQLKALLDRAKADLQAAIPDALRAVGVQLLSFAERDYIILSRGGTTADGRRWRKLDRDTVAARVRSRAPARRIVSQRRALARQIRAVKGRGADARRQALRRQRSELSARLEAMIDAEMSQQEIGVNTGLQRASSQPGFVGPDGRGGNVFEVDPQAASVTIGYGRDYSDDFDAQRPLLPDDLPESWIDAATSTLEIQADRILQESLK